MRTFLDASLLVGTKVTDEEISVETMSIISSVDHRDWLRFKTNLSEKIEHELIGYDDDDIDDDMFDEYENSENKIQFPCIFENDNHYWTIKCAGKLYAEGCF